MAPALALLLAGCAPCPPWSEVEIAGHGSIDLDALLQVQAAFAEFVAWSGREGSCATRIDVFPAVEDRSGQLAGDYSYFSGQIRISDGYPDPWLTTTHELCHAVDDQEGWSRDNPDLFGLELLPREAAAEVADRRREESEVFALACEGGARDVDRWEIVEEQCGIELPAAELAAQRFVQDRVYPAAPRIPWHEPAFELEIGDPWRLPEAGPGWRFEGLMGAGDAAAALYSWRGSRPRADGATSQVLRLDPGTGALRGAHAWAACGWLHREGCRVQLVPGDGGVWALASSAGGASLWRVEPAGAAREALCGWEPEDAGDLVVAGGALWSVEAGQAAACDLATGRERAVPPGPEPDFPPYSAYFAADPGALPRPAGFAVGSRPGAWWPGAGMAWLDGETWRTAPLPSHHAVVGIAPLADGTWLLLHPPDEKGQEPGAAVSRLDPASGALSAPDRACLPLAGSLAGLAGGEGWALLLETPFAGEAAPLSEGKPEYSLTPLWVR